MFCLDLQLEVSNLTLNGIPTGKDSKDVTVFQHKTGKSSLARGEFRRERGGGGGVKEMMACMPPSFLIYC